MSEHENPTTTPEPAPTPPAEPAAPTAPAEPQTGHGDPGNAGTGEYDAS